jgi:hypothetical protein
MMINELTIDESSYVSLRGKLTNPFSQETLDFAVEGTAVEEPDHSGLYIMRDTGSNLIENFWYELRQGDQIICGVTTKPAVGEEFSGQWSVRASRQ